MQFKSIQRNSDDYTDDQLRIYEGEMEAELQKGKRYDSRKKKKKKKKSRKSNDGDPTTKTNTAETIETAIATPTSTSTSFVPDINKFVKVREGRRVYSKSSRVLLNGNKEIIWKIGEIALVNERNQTYEIEFDDGDWKSNVTADEIKVTEDGSSRNKTLEDYHLLSLFLSTKERKNIIDHEISGLFVNYNQTTHQKSLTRSDYDPSNW